MSCPPPNPATYCERNFIETCQNPIGTANMYAPTSSGGSYPFGPMEDWNSNCPPKPTVCRDTCDYSPLARLVITITSLRNSNGSTLDEITEQHNGLICPEKLLSETEVSILLSQGTRQGIFVYNATTGTYKVYGAFGVLPSNQQFVKELGPGFQLCLGMYCNAH